MQIEYSPYLSANTHFSVPPRWTSRKNRRFLGVNR
nr:MAG TPA: hypothetical protein [Caudoviricetes sp.]